MVLLRHSSFQFIFKTFVTIFTEETFCILSIFFTFTFFLYSRPAQLELIHEVHSWMQLKNIREKKRDGHPDWAQCRKLEKSAEEKKTGSRINENICEKFNFLGKKEIKRRKQYAQNWLHQIFCVRQHSIIRRNGC